MDTCTQLTFFLKIIPSPFMQQVQLDNNITNNVNSRLPLLAFKFGEVHSNLTNNSSLWSVIVGVILIVTNICLLLVLYKRPDTNFGTLPGPKGIWIVGNAHKLWNPKERIYQLTSWAFQYKPCCLLKFGTYKIVLLTTASSAQKLFSSSDPSYMNKGVFYDVFKPFWGDGLIISDVDKWKERRKVLNRAFTVKSFMGYMQVYNEESRSLVESLQNEFSNSGENQTILVTKPVDHILYHHALRVICGTTMGIDIWDIEDSDKLATILIKGQEMCMTRIMQPWFMNDWLWSWHPNYRKLDKIGKKLFEFTGKVITLKKQQLATLVEQDKNTYESEEYTPGMKRKFTSLIEEMIMAGWDDQSLIEEVNTFVTSGYDTTASTLQFLLFCLALNPKHQELCRNEVDQIFEDVSLCPDDDLLYEALARNEMKYLERCIFETLRLYPMIAWYFRRLEAPLRIDEKIELPNGMNVGVFLPGLHRDPTYFPNPDVFDPDRFLPENSKQRSQYAYLPFSAGTRNCIGYKFGMNEIKVMAARILRHFKIETTDTVDTVGISIELFLSSERGYNFIFTKRH